MDLLGAFVHYVDYDCQHQIMVLALAPTYGSRADEKPL